MNSATEPSDMNTGNPVNEDALIRQYSDLAYSIAHSYRHGKVPLEDLRQEALFGIIEAARHFDPARNVKFSTYAVYWIKRRILTALSNESQTSLNAVELSNETLDKMESCQPLQPVQATGDEDILPLPENMPRLERTVLILSYQKQLTIKEIGEKLGISNEKVKQLRQKALRRMRAIRT